MGSRFFKEKIFQLFHENYIAKIQTLILILKTALYEFPIPETYTIIETIFY